MPCPLCRASIDKVRVTRHVTKYQDAVDAFITLHDYCEDEKKRHVIFSLMLDFIWDNRCIAEELSTGIIDIVKRKILLMRKADIYNELSTDEREWIDYVVDNINT